LTLQGLLSNAGNVSVVGAARILCANCSIDNAAGVCVPAAYAAGPGRLTWTDQAAFVVRSSVPTALDGDGNASFVNEGLLVWTG
jgi:hypothetical protein